MRARFVVATVLSIGLPATALLPSLFGVEHTAGAAPPSAADAAAATTATTSAADGGRPPAPPRPPDPNNVTNLSPFMDLCLQGNAKYLSGDYPGAIATYRQAIQQSVKHPLGYYLLGEALLASGNLQEAEERWKQADSNSGSGDPTMRARVLFVLASLKERQGKWDEAKAAWANYNEWAGRFGDAGPEAGIHVFPESANARLKAIDERMKLDKQMELVKQRIREAAAVDGGLFTTLDATPG